jgi:uncharacterized membrane protein SpoIIM required for sporulation
VFSLGAMIVSLDKTTQLTAFGWMLIAWLFIFHIAEAAVSIKGLMKYYQMHQFSEK